jgi:hypothetical protein
MKDIKNTLRTWKCSKAIFLRILLLAQKEMLLFYNTYSSSWKKPLNGLWRMLIKNLRSRIHLSKSLRRNSKHNLMKSSSSNFKIRTNTYKRSKILKIIKLSCKQRKRLWRNLSRWWSRKRWIMKEFFLIKLVNLRDNSNKTKKT